MHFTLHQLKVFQKVAEKQSITKAAAELHLTQPAVSIQMRKFQDQFDIPLIDNIGRKMHLTEFGLEIAETIQKVLQEVQEIERRTLAYKGAMVGPLRISVVSTGKYVMPYFLSGFLGDHPGIDLRMDVTNKSQVVEALEENKVDFALVSKLPEHFQVEKITLMENKLFLIGKSGGEHSGKVLDPKVLESIPLIYRENGSATRHAMERFIKDRSILQKKTMQLTSNEAVKQAVVAGLGYSIMPLIGIQNELANKSVEILQMDGLPIVTNWNLIWLKGKSPTPIATAYLEYLKAEKDAVIADRFAWHEGY